MIKMCKTSQINLQKQSGGEVRWMTEQVGQAGVISKENKDDPD